MGGQCGYTEYGTVLAMISFSPMEKTTVNVEVFEKIAWLAPRLAFVVRIEDRDAVPFLLLSKQKHTPDET